MDAWDRLDARMRDLNFEAMLDTCTTCYYTIRCTIPCTM